MVVFWGLGVELGGRAWGQGVWIAPGMQVEEEGLSPEVRAKLRVRVESGVLEGTARRGTWPDIPVDVDDYRPGDVRVFRGIPYAAAPVGRLRWRAPEPPVAWEGVRSARGWGPLAPQPDRSLSFWGGAGRGGDTESEDCLFANVWTGVEAGREREGKLRPVIVWVHGGWATGGGFTMGSGSERAMEGTRLAQRGVVVVSFNYRLGPLGFMALPELSAEAEKETGRRTSGNYGLADQLALLRWVRRNIEAFGGDPNNVTLAGQGAGAAAIARHMINPETRGLYHKVILESPGPLARSRRLTEDVGRMLSGERMGERLMDRIGARSLQELRQADTETVMSVAAPAVLGPGDRYGPVVDGVYVPEDPEAAWREGREVRVPMLIGTNSNDGSMLVPEGQFMSVKDYESAVKTLLGESGGAEVLRRVPARSDDEAREAAVRLATAMSFVAPVRAMVRAHAAAVPGGVFEYHFTRVPETRMARRNGAFHGLEVLYAFENVVTSDNPGIPPGFVDADRQLSRRMASAWVAFASTGNPSTPELRWPVGGGETGEYVELGSEVTVRRGLQREVVDALERVLEEGRSVAH